MLFSSGIGVATRVALACAYASLAIACEAGGVGDPCVADPDEYVETFSGYSVGEVNVTSRSYDCESRVCLVNNFQGRVSCPYGSNGPPELIQADDRQTVTHSDQCFLPGGLGTVQVPVRPQRLERQPEDAVYCSCRCNGPDPNARYCECPSGFECRELVPPSDTGPSGRAGSYCIRSGTFVENVGDISQDVCDWDLQNCGPRAGAGSGT
jgi:hypothetical protein